MELLPRNWRRIKIIAINLKQKAGKLREVIEFQAETAHLKINRNLCSLKDANRWNHNDKSMKSSQSLFLLILETF